MRILIAVLAIVVGLPAAAQERLALIIGNDSYAEVPVLRKARADARAIGAELRRQGFGTIEALDQTRRQMNRSISEFTARLEPGDTAFVFFAGHGVEIDGENYLLPTDIVAPASGEDDFVKSESIALSDLLDRVRATGARTSIVIVDACRNNPFETTTGRSIGRTRGLGRIAAPQGMFVIFSAGAGQLALDELYPGEPAENSVFTRALLPRLTTPGLELRALVADLRLEVRELARTVQHDQIPAYYDEMLGEFYFTPAATPAPGTSGTAAAGSVGDQMRADLALARSIGTPQALDGFLESYRDQADSFSYRMALRLRDDLDIADAQPAAPASTQRSAAPGSDPAPALSTPVLPRDIMRDTQLALNAAGCSAGGADGIEGPQTRRAYARFLADSGADLAAGDLGTERALRVIAAAASGTCKPVAVTAPNPAPSAQPADTNGLSLAGNWQYKANCVLVVNVTGRTSYRHGGSNFYHGRVTDSLGQTANSEVYLNGRDLSGTDYFPGITVTWRGRLAADGNSFTATGSTGCSVYAWRAG